MCVVSEHTLKPEGDLNQGESARQSGARGLKGWDAWRLQQPGDSGLWVLSVPAYFSCGRRCIPRVAWDWPVDTGTQEECVDVRETILSVTMS